MEKDYRRWHEVKRVLNGAGIQKFDEGDVWWTSVGCNMGNEEDGKGDKFSRPVLVVCKFNSEFLYGVPMSTVMKSGLYYLSVTLNGQKRNALLSQLRAYDARRLLKRVGSVHHRDLMRARVGLCEIIRRERSSK